MTESKLSTKNKEVLEKWMTITRRGMLRLNNVWSEMFILDDEKWTEKINQFTATFEGIINDLCEEEESNRDKLNQKIAACIREQAQLQDELKMDIPFAYDANKPLEPRLEELESKLEAFRLERDKRLKKMRELIDEEKTLCKTLGAREHKHVEGVPSQTQIQELEQRIFDLHQLQFEREQIVQETREKIKDLLDILEKEPTSQFELDLFSDSTFSITEDNMTQLKNLEKYILNEKEISENRKEILLSQLEEIWNKINTDREYRCQFIQSHTGIGKTAMDAIKTEIERCEEVRRANLEPLITIAKEDIKRLWLLCHVSEAERALFSPFYNATVSEDMLDLHELERDRLHKFYEINKSIFDNVEKWENLCNRSLQLEEKAKDKSRLFDNRGGQLLKEEKERKTIDRKLPKLYEELSELLKKFQIRHEKPFLYDGFDLLEKITSDFEQREASKATKRGTVSESSSSQNSRASTAT